MPRADFAHSHRFRVRYGEVDPHGVVFNARYLDYADIAVTEYWRAITAAGLWDGDIPECHVAKADVIFRKPILADEEIDVMARTPRFGTTSMTTLVEIHGVGPSTSAGRDDLRAAVELVAVHVDLADHRPRPLPNAVRRALSAFDARAADR
jgi:acyl-CoA thioester hydrolase